MKIDLRIVLYIKLISIELNFRLTRFQIGTYSEDETLRFPEREAVEIGCIKGESNSEV